RRPLRAGERVRDSQRDGGALSITMAGQESHRAATIGGGCLPVHRATDPADWYSPGYRPTAPYTRNLAVLGLRGIKASRTPNWRPTSRRDPSALCALR